jgi:hypothetical protein
MSESDMGSHLVQQQSNSSVDKKHFSAATVNNQDSTQINSSIFHSAISTYNVLSDFNTDNHPSAMLSRKETTEIERQNINIKVEYSESIEIYTR